MSEPRPRPTTQPGPVPRDSIDRVLSGWAASRPELDVTPVTVVARLARANALVREGVEAVLAQHGLSAASFTVLAALGRLGAVPPAQLEEELGLAAEELRERLDLLSADGLVDQGDVVALTDAGTSSFEAVTPEHLRNEAQLLAGLTDDEREALAILLRKLVVSLETG